MVKKKSEVRSKMRKTYSNFRKITRSEYYSSKNTSHLRRVWKNPHFPLGRISFSLRFADLKQTLLGKLWVENLHRKPCPRKVWKNAFLQGFCYVIVQVCARSGLITIFKLKMRWFGHWLWLNILWIIPSKTNIAIA